MSSQPSERILQLLYLAYDKFSIAEKQWELGNFKRFHMDVADAELYVLDAQTLYMRDENELSLVSRVKINKELKEVLEITERLRKNVT